MRRLIALGAALALALSTCGDARASDVQDAAMNTITANVTLVTTAETVIVTSDPVRPPYATSRVVVLAWGQLTTGGSTTAVTARIRRGTTASGTLIGEANAEGVKIAAGGTEPFFIIAAEQLGNVESATYVLTLEQTGAAANGSALQAGIVVLVF